MYKVYEVEDDGADFVLVSDENRVAFDYREYGKKKALALLLNSLSVAKGEHVVGFLPSMRGGTEFTFVTEPIPKSEAVINEELRDAMYDAMGSGPVIDVPVKLK